MQKILNIWGPIAKLGLTWCHAFLGQNEYLLFTIILMNDGLEYGKDQLKVEAQKYMTIEVMQETLKVLQENCLVYLFGENTQTQKQQYNRYNNFTKIRVNQAIVDDLKTQLIKMGEKRDVKNQELQNQMNDQYIKQCKVCGQKYSLYEVYGDNIQKCKILTCRSELEEFKVDISLQRNIKSFDKILAYLNEIIEQCAQFQFPSDHDFQTNQILNQQQEGPKIERRYEEHRINIFTNTIEKQIESYCHYQIAPTIDKVKLIISDINEKHIQVKINLFTSANPQQPILRERICLYYEYINHCNPQFLHQGSQQRELFSLILVKIFYILLIISQLNYLNQNLLDFQQRVLVQVLFFYYIKIYLFGSGDGGVDVQRLSYEGASIAFKIQFMKEALIKPPRTRRLCCCRIESNWSITNQILISLLVLSSLTFAFITSLVILGLYLTKYYFLQYSQVRIEDTVKGQYSYEASILTQNINIQSQFQQQDIPTYQNISNSVLTQIPYTIYNQIEGLEESQTVGYQFVYNGTERLLAGYINVKQGVTDYPYTIVLVFVPSSDAYSEVQKVENDTTISFQQNLYTTLEAIGAAFILCFLMGWIFTFYITKPLKQLTQYAEEINYKTTQGVKSKKQPTIKLNDIHAEDKIGELVEVFKNLIQGLAGLKKKKSYHKQEIQTFFDGTMNLHKKQYQEIKIDQVQSDIIIT
ncbi:hypothetical protein pb186bvf_009057 [Paramecium bursaria]